jgi:hypothetical protein
MKKTLVIIGFLVLMVLHQDFWNWDNGNLVFGIMPVALAYHTAYTIIVSIFWALVIRFAWPKDIEEWAEGGGSEKEPPSTGDQS